MRESCRWYSAINLMTPFRSFSQTAQIPPAQIPPAKKAIALTNLEEGLLLIGPTCAKPRVGKG